MKVPPKRKGNAVHTPVVNNDSVALNESPSEKEGKWSKIMPQAHTSQPSMKVPPKRKGNNPSSPRGGRLFGPSMKVPPKRKGNEREDGGTHRSSNPQ